MVGKNSTQLEWRDYLHILCHREEKNDDICSMGKDERLGIFTGEREKKNV